MLLLAQISDLNLPGAGCWQSRTCCVGSRLHGSAREAARLLMRTPVLSDDDLPKVTAADDLPLEGCPNSAAVWSS